MKCYDNGNVFAKILRGELACAKVYDDENVLVFHDKYPDAPVHLLIIPKKQYTSFDDFINNGLPEEIVYFFKIIRKITHEYGLEKTGYRLVTNHGKHGEQVVSHFHFHILGGKNLGKQVNPYE